MIGIARKYRGVKRFGVVKLAMLMGAPCPLEHARQQRLQMRHFVGRLSNRIGDRRSAQRS